MPTAKRNKDVGVPKLPALKSKAQRGRFAKTQVSNARAKEEDGRA